MYTPHFTGPEPATSMAEPLWQLSHGCHQPLLKGNESMDAGDNLGSAAKGSAIDLEVAGSGPVSYSFSFPSLSYHV